VPVIAIIALPVPAVAVALVPAVITAVDPAALVGLLPATPVVVPGVPAVPIGAGAVVPAAALAVPALPIGAMVFDMTSLFSQAAQINEIAANTLQATDCLISCLPPVMVVSAGEWASYTAAHGAQHADIVQKAGET
jgi:hypothetical protein